MRAARRVGISTMQRLYSMVRGEGPVIRASVKKHSGSFEFMPNAFSAIIPSS